MLGFPLGILSAAGAGGVVGSYELIETHILASAAPSISFISIPATYAHLQVRVVAKTARDDRRTLRMRFNDITTTSYAHHILRGNGSSVLSEATTSDNAIDFRDILELTTGGNTTFGAGVIDILDYASTSKNTTTRAISGNSVAVLQRVIALNSGLLNNTAAINKITFLSSLGNLGSGSRFSLYGIKG